MNELERDIAGPPALPTTAEETQRMRNALIVGINHYDQGSPLFGCVDDAHAVRRVISRHGDGSIDFDVKLLTGTKSSPVTRARLKDELEALFSAPGETALFYFAGHGHIETIGGYLLASDARRGDEGLALSDVLTLASRSAAHNKIIVLDSCHSGIAGTRPTAGPFDCCWPTCTRSRRLTCTRCYRSSARRTICSAWQVFS